MRSCTYLLIVQQVAQQYNDVHMAPPQNVRQEMNRRRRHRRLTPATASGVDAGEGRAEGAPVMGSSGSRLLSGNSRYAEELESWIARFHGRDAALLFNSGYDANVGLMSCLPQPGDAVVCDELVHNSVRVRSAIMA